MEWSASVICLLQRRIEQVRARFEVIDVSVRPKRSERQSEFSLLAPRWEFVGEVRIEIVCKHLFAHGTHAGLRDSVQPACYCSGYVQ